MPRFDEEISRGQVAAALITSMFGCDLAPPAFKIMPRRLLAAMTDAAMRKEDRQAVPGGVTMREVAPTLRYEGLLLAETAGTVSRYADVAADVLLMGGDLEQQAFLRPAFDALARTLPRNRQAVFPGLDHGASGDPGPANRGARPAVLAPEIRAFFAGHERGRRAAQAGPPGGRSGGTAGQLGAGPQAGVVRGGAPRPGTAQDDRLAGP